MAPSVGMLLESPGDQLRNRLLGLGAATTLARGVGPDEADETWIPWMGPDLESPSRFLEWSLAVERRLDGGGRSGLLLVDIMQVRDKVRCG